MAQLNGIIRGNANDVATNETISPDTIYNLQDLQGISITNAQMTNALTKAQEGFIKPDSVWFCTDNGTYLKDHFYQFTITGTSPLDNVASWTDLGTLGGGSPADNIIDIGAGQVTFEDGTVYPTISKTDADEIYLKYVSGQPITLLWGTTGIATHISVIYASDISGYEIDCIIHGKVAQYSWTNSTTGSITPTINGATVQGETWVFNSTINISNMISENDLTFTSNGESFNWFIADHRSGEVSYNEFNVVYNHYDGGWINQAYRTVIFETAPTGDFRTWLQANATLQS